MLKVLSLALSLAVASSGLFVSSQARAAEPENVLVTSLKGANLLKKNKILAEISPQGFHPSDGNYAKFKFAIPQEAFFYDIDYMVIIYRSDIKDPIFVRYIDGENTSNYISVIWNGKASEGNPAGFETNGYVPEGKYIVRAFAFATDENGERIQVGKKKKTFNVSAQAPAGQAGIDAALRIPIYSQDEATNYMISRMVQQAGVDINMSEPDRVEKLYRWEINNFTHVHEFPEGDPIWDLDALAAEIEAYAAQTDREVAEGRAIKVQDYTNTYLDTYQAGTCTNNAAVFKTLLNFVGIDAGMCGGNYLNRNGTKSPHNWNNAIVNGVLRIYDVDVELQNLGKVSGLYWFDKSREESNSIHEYSFEEVILF